MHPDFLHGVLHLALVILLILRHCLIIPLIADLEWLIEREINEKTLGGITAVHAGEEEVPRRDIVAHAGSSGIFGVLECDSLKLVEDVSAVDKEGPVQTLMDPEPILPVPRNRQVVPEAAFEEPAVKENSSQLRQVIEGNISVLVIEIEANSRDVRLFPEKRIEAPGFEGDAFKVGFASGELFRIFILSLEKGALGGIGFGISIVPAQKKRSRVETGSIPSNQAGDVPGENSVLPRA